MARCGRWCVLAAALVCFLLMDSPCSAQVAKYQPSSPTVSPYLNLTRFNGGGLPNYYALVRPRIQQREFNLREQALRREQTQEILRIDNELTRGFETSSGTGTGSWFQVPGQRSSYLDTSRYYVRPVPMQRR